MALRRLEEPEIPSTVDAATGVSLLKKQIVKANTLLEARVVESVDHTAWANTTQDYLIKAFGSKSKNISAVIHASSGVPLHMGMSDYEIQQHNRSLLQNQIKMLASCVEQLETEIELGKSRNEFKSSSRETPTASRRIFVVHGSNHGVKETVARTLAKLALDPVILHEQPNQGRTLIEKFEDYADVGFAVVLLTADDVGGERGKEVLPRARQNVILELGYFLGRLERSRVCVLYERGVERPSDYDGVAYVELDAAERWKFDLVKELRAAGYHVDANKLF